MRILMKWLVFGIAILLMVSILKHYEMDGVNFKRIEEPVHTEEQFNVEEVDL